MGRQAKLKKIRKRYREISKEMGAHPSHVYEKSNGDISFIFTPEDLADTDLVDQEDLDSWLFDDFPFRFD